MFEATSVVTRNTSTENMYHKDMTCEGTKFVRATGDDIPTKKRPLSESELSIVQERKQIFKDLVRGGMETQTLSVADQYLLDAVCDTIWDRNTDGQKVSDLSRCS